MFHVDEKRATGSNSRLVLTEGQSTYRGGLESIFSCSGTVGRQTQSNPIAEVHFRVTRQRSGTRKLGISPFAADNSGNRDAFRVGARS
jgi:hypothetical protein